MDQVTAHPEAAAELREAIRFYENKLPGLGRRFFTDISYFIALIVENSARFAIRTAGTRRANLKVFPFNINYLDESDTIAIIAVANNRRRTDYWKDRMPASGQPTNWGPFPS